VLLLFKGPFLFSGQKTPSSRKEITANNAISALSVRRDIFFFAIVDPTTINPLLFNDFV
jgi:hypothetical protein